MSSLRHCGALATVIGMGLATSLPAMANPTINVGGRIHLDTAFHNDDVTELDNGMLVRRARLGGTGSFGDGWGYKAEWDFAENNTSATDIFISYSKLGPGTLKLGQFKVPFGLNELTSSNSITFIERTLGTEAFADSRRLGMGYEQFTDSFGYQFMVYGRRIGTGQPEGDQPIGIGGRIVSSPNMGDGGRLHFGLALAHESTDDADAVRFRARPESRAGGTPRLVDTGTVNNVNNTTKLGLEAAWLQGPLSLEGEWMRTFVGRGSGDSDVDFTAWHLQAGYVINGERPYRGGRFRTVSANSDAGAWEVAARYSSVDLNDGVVAGGEQENLTLALNYYASSNVRFMGNVIRAEQKDTGDKPWILALRAQVNF